MIEKYPVIAEIWRWLISASPAEVLSIPLVDAIDDLPEVPAGARALVGFNLSAATTSPRKTLSSGRVKLRGMGRVFEGWTEAMRQRVAEQVPLIKHWRILEGDFLEMAAQIDDSDRATWFVDPPYNNKAGSYYVHSKLDFQKLGHVCQSLPGQVIVCENAGASWLPFKDFGTFKAGLNGKGSREVIWLSTGTPA